MLLGSVKAMIIFT